MQRPGIDFEEIFALVARLESVRLLLAIAAHFGWGVHHMDVKSAFLNGELRRYTYNNLLSLSTARTSTRCLASTRLCTDSVKLHGPGTRSSTLLCSASASSAASASTVCTPVAVAQVA